MRVRSVFLTTLALATASVAFAHGPSKGQISAHTVKITKRIIGQKAYPNVIDTRTMYPQINPIHPLQFKREHEQGHAPIQPGPAWSAIGLPPVGKADGPPTKFAHLAFARSIDGDGYEPPDPMMAVGPQNIVEGVNVEIAFLSKEGNPEFVQPFNGSGFFRNLGVTGSVITDPKITYDPNSGRFFAMMLEVSGPAVDGSPVEIGKILLGVSATSNPNGKWYTYRIDDTTTVNGDPLWMDYPSIAVSATGVVVSGNMFSFIGGPDTAGEFVVMPKQALINGQPVTPTILEDLTGLFTTPRMVADWSPSQTNIYGVGLASTSTIRIYSVDNPDTTPDLQFVDVPVNPFAFDPSGVASTSSGAFLDLVGDRMYQAWEQNGHIVTGHTVADPSGSGTAAAEWMQFNINGWPSSGTNPTLNQEGDISTPGGSDSWMPAICESPRGDMSVIYSRSSVATTPQIMMTSRLSTDPLGQMNTPTLLTSGLSPFFGSAPGPGFVSRWGDFFECALDPTDNKTFYGISMTSDFFGDWQTYIFNWQVSANVAPPVDFDPNGISLYEGTSATGSVAGVSTLGDMQYYTVSSKAMGRLGQVASAQVTYNVGGPMPTLQALNEKVGTIAPGGSTVFIFAKNVITGRFDMVQSYAGNPIDAEQIIHFPSPASNYMDGNGNVTVIIRAIAPNRRGFAQKPFLFQIDEAVLQTVSN